MSRLEIRDLGEPEAVVTYPLGATYQVRLAGMVVSHHVLQPGWSWEEHAPDGVEALGVERQPVVVIPAGAADAQTVHPLALPATVTGNTALFTDAP